MKKIGVYSTNSHEAKRIAYEAKKMGYEVYEYDYLADDKNWLIPDIGIFRTVIDRTVGVDNAEIARKHAERITNSGGYVFNYHAVADRILDKVEQQNLFEANGLPCIKSYKPTELPYPVIAKPRHGSLGMGVTILRNTKDFNEFKSNHEIETHIFQELLEVGHDYRVLVLGGVSIGVMERRAAKGKIVANYSQGGSVSKAILPMDIVHLAEKVAKAAKLEYAGVDLIKDSEGGWRVLEYNRCAQFKGFELSTGVNVAKKIVEYCIKQDGKRIKYADMKSQRIAVGMSGGVDSSVAAALLKEEGYEVVGVYIEAYNEPGCRTDQDKKDALQAALKIGIPFQVIDVREQYKEKVVAYFLDTYRNGKTPNPDIVCNREVKFGIFYDWAIENGFDRVATGHYAKVTEYSYCLKKDIYLQRPFDLKKDQTYFLYQIPKENIKSIVFPLGGMTKDQVRLKALSLGLSNAHKPDSMGVCMMGELNVTQFLRTKLGENPGKVLFKEREVGTHQGLWFHTIGQRGGFELDKKKMQGMGYHPENMQPLYVVGKNIERNELLLGEKQETGTKKITMIASELYIDQKCLLEMLGHGKLYLRIRNLGELVNIKALKMDGNSINITVERMMYGVAQGQAAVFYLRLGKQNEEIVVGGGEIS